jgi:amidase
MAPDLISLSATEMARLVRAKAVSPVELVEAHLDRIARVNPALHAFAHLDAEGARAQATEATIVRSRVSQPLRGVPITIKSSIDVAGLRCECGTRLRQGHVAAGDAPLVARLRAAGAVILGVTNVPELLMAYETDNFLYGRTNNPWDLSRTAGGSSGGESAAIAARCSAAGIGSDGGGSVRVPAHFCGICALKPTPGRIPITGHYPAAAGPSTITAVAGPMARRVADLRLLFEVTTGHNWYDSASAPVAVRHPRREEVRRLRVAYFEDDGLTPVTDETRTAVRRAARALQEQGFTVEAYRPAGLEQARQTWWTLFGESGALLVEAMVGDRLAEIHPLSLDLLGAGPEARRAPFEKLLMAWVARDLMRERLLRQMEDWPVLLCPVGALPAFRHGERLWQIGSATVTYPEAFSYCQMFNLLGNPAVVAPVGRSPEGLPIGVQVVGRPWEDEIVLAVAEELEIAVGSPALPERPADLTGR